MAAGTATSKGLPAGSVSVEGGAGVIYHRSPPPRTGRVKPMAPEARPAIQQYLTALAVEPEDGAALEALEEIVTAGNGAGDPLNRRALAEARQLHLLRGDV